MKNKGFSLIELIIVIAIMAVLVAIIAPNLTKYLGASKEKTDVRNKDEVKHQVVNCISEAATKDIDVISMSGGATDAYYELEYDSTNKVAKANAGANGVDDFAELLSESLEDAKVVSMEDKNNDKMEIKISKRISGGYDVEVSYTS